MTQLSRSPLRLIQVGAGGMGRAWLATIAANPDVERVGLVDLSVDTATAAAAEHLGLVAPGCLPRPLLGLGAEDRAEVADVVDRVLDGGPATRP